jgi:DNA repair exonuclease SbcCD nuclease subunit
MFTESRMALPPKKDPKTGLVNPPTGVYAQASRLAKFMHDAVVDANKKYSDAIINYDTIKAEEPRYISISTQIKDELDITSKNDKAKIEELNKIHKEVIKYYDFLKQAEDTKERLRIRFIEKKGEYERFVKTQANINAVMRRGGGRRTRRKGRKAH